MTHTPSKNTVEVLLISPPLQGPGIYTKSLATALPLGLLRICAALEAIGISTTVLNATPFQRWDTVQSLVESSLASLAPGGVVGVSANVTMLRGGAYRIVDLVRSLRGDAVIGLGGIHATHTYTSLINSLPLDFVALGECEENFPEFIQTRASGASVPGIVTSIPASAVASRPCFVDQLDALPIPDYGKVNLKIQRALYARPSGAYCFDDMMLEDGLVIETSRGCPHACAFCGVASRPWRAHSAEYVVAWISSLYERFQFNSYTFIDDFFTKSRERVMELCSHLERMKDPVIWAAQTRADMTDPDMLRAMKAAGCRLLAFGVESGAPAVRKKLKKNLLSDRIVDAVADARAAGIRSQVFFLVGNPDETTNHIHDSIHLIESIAPDFICVDSLKIFPGTLLFDEAKKQGRLDDTYWLDGGNHVPEYSKMSEQALNRLKMRIEYAWRKSRKKPPPRRALNWLGADFKVGAHIGGIVIHELFAGRPGNLHLVVSDGGASPQCLLLDYSLVDGTVSFQLSPDPYADGTQGGSTDNRTIHKVVKYLEKRALERGVRIDRQ